VLSWPSESAVTAFTPSCSDIISLTSDLLDQSNHPFELVLYLTDVLSAATTTSRRRIDQSRQNSIKDGEDLFIFLPSQPNVSRNTVSSLSTER
jgi:hypothetical protein